jgi:uncharacterized RDD family membrane protein YckC
MTRNKAGSGASEGRGGRARSLVIITPEGIAFSMLLAGPVARGSAWAIDLACIAAATVFLNTLIRALGPIHRDFFLAASVLAYFIITLGYGMATEWYWRGQTLGKRLLRLRVLDVQGLRLRFSQIAVRNLLRIVDGLPGFYLAGGLACLWSRHAQRLGDLAANTVVVRSPGIREPDLERLLPGKFNSLRDYPHLAARLRQRTTPQEADIALQALLRREDLEPQARIELFAEISSHFHSLVEFPEEAVFGVSSEQYVSNVVDIVFRNSSVAAARQKL